MSGLRLLYVAERDANRRRGKERKRQGCPVASVPPLTLAPVEPTRQTLLPVSRPSLLSTFIPAEDLLMTAASEVLYQIRFLSLKSSLANLPPTLYSTLVAAQKASPPSAAALAWLACLRREG